LADAYIQGAPVFYDNWVARDINGTALENAPFEQVFHHTESNHRFQRHLPIQGELAEASNSNMSRNTHTQSNLAGTVSLCWTRRHSTTSRTSSSAWPGCPRASAPPRSVPSSAVSFANPYTARTLTADDYWNAGYGRIIMVPRVKLAYDKVGPIARCMAYAQTDMAESLRHHPPREAELDGDPGLQAHRRTAG